MLQLFISLELACNSSSYISFHNGSCTMCTEPFSYSSWNQMCDCPKGYIYDRTAGTGELTCIVSKTSGPGMIFPAISTLSTISGSEINCPAGLSLGHSSTKAPTCGIPIRIGYSLFDNEAQSQCQKNASLIYSTHFGECYFNQDLITVGDGSNPEHAIVQEAVNLCSQFGHQGACRSVINHCSNTMNSGNVLCTAINNIAVSNRPENNQFYVYNSGRVLSKYSQYNGNLSEQAKYKNIHGMKYVISNLNGVILHTSQFFPQYFDLCNVIQSGLDPLIMQWQANSNIFNRDRRISRNKTYYNLEMLSRSGLDYLDAEYSNKYQSMFGNNFTRTCAIGNSALKYIENGLFISMYTDNAENNTIVPILIEGQTFYSLPVMQADNVTYKVLTGLELNFTTTSDSSSTMPEVTAKYTTFTSVAASPYLFNDLSKYTFLPKTNKFANDYMNFTISANYFGRLSPSRTLEMAIVAICAAIGLFFAFGEVKRTSGLGFAVVSIESLGYWFIGFRHVVRAAGLGCIVSLAVHYAVALVNVEFDAAVCTFSVYCLFAVSVAQLLLRALVVFLPFYKLKRSVFVFDHGDTDYSPRRFFMLNAISQLFREEFVSFYGAVFFTVVVVAVFDLQYTTEQSAALSTSLGMFESGRLSLPFCFVAVCVYIFLGIFQWLYRFFRGNKFERLGDAATLANCSVIAFDCENAGHLLYGKSVSGDTDVDPDVLQNALKMEAKGLLSRRGLHLAQSGQYFRIFTRNDEEVVKELQKVLETLKKHEENVSGDFGDAVEGRSDYTNWKSSPRMPKLSKDRVDSQLGIQGGAQDLIMYLSQQPLFYTTRIMKMFDIAPIIPKQFKIALVVDPSEGFGPRSADLGARPPGGFGATPWLSQFFDYHKSLWDFVCLIGLSTALAQFGLPIGYAFLIIFLILWVIRELQVLRLKKDLGMCNGVADSLLR